MHYKLFLDLDGVLVDFERGVRSVTGREVGEMTPRQMWPALAKSKGFYDNLHWMTDGKDLWDFSQNYNPTILTGLPLGKWAEPQKRSWCRRELGKDVPVICCMTRDKAQEAFDQTHENSTPILVDDRIKTKESWEAMGGIFIFHTDAASSIEALKMYFTI